MILANHGIVSSSGGAIPSTLLNNLISYYKAESNANDSLGTYNGTAQGGLTYSTGKSGNSFDLNGTNAYVEFGDNHDIGLLSKSFSCWIKTTSTSGYKLIISKSFSAATGGRYYITQFDNKIQFSFDANGNVIVIQSNANINTNTWYHLTAVLDRTDKLKLYINGSLDASTVTAGTNNLTSYSSDNFTTTTPFRIGAYTASDNTTPSLFFTGLIDEVGVWNRVLTTTEITELQTKYYPF